VIFREESAAPYGRNSRPSRISAVEMDTIFLAFLAIALYNIKTFRKKQTKNPLSSYFLVAS
jgi:hypothetical protein